MLFDYVCGGELFSYLRNAGRFSSSTGIRKKIKNRFIFFFCFFLQVIGNGLSIDDDDDTANIITFYQIKERKYDGIRIYDDCNR